jgi:hypothetical protein
MVQGLWLPKEYELPNGSKIRQLLYSGDEWQILETDGSKNALLVRSTLLRKWDDCGFLDESAFTEISFGNELFQILSSHKKYVLAPAVTVKLSVAYAQFLSCNLHGNQRLFSLRV